MPRLDVGRCLIPDLLKGRGWTARQLESLSGVPDSTISRFMRGESRYMTIDVAIAIADAFNVHPRELFEWIPKA